jgi:hypothetical protein
MPQFNATRYASQWLMNLDRRTVAREITNQNYSPITGARAVKVFQANDLSAPNKNADNSVNIQNPTGGSTTMTLDEERDLTVGIPSVEEFQSQVNVQSKFRERQAQAGEEDLDDFILGKYPDAGITLSTTASTASGFGDKIRDAKVALSDNNVPRSERFMVLSPFYADLVAEDAGDRIDRNRDIEVEGFIGRYQGFDLFESTGIVETGTSPGKQHLVFGHRQAIILAVQMDGVALVDNADQARFHGDVLKALMVYGGQTFLPDALGDLEADIPS